MGHEDKIEKAKAAIDAVGNDMSVKPSENKSSLNDLIAHCGIIIESLDITEDGES